MTEQQRRAIEILNGIKEKKDIGNGNHVSLLSDDDYFFLLSFIIDKQETVVYPWTQPCYPWTSPVTYETTCSTGEQQ